MEDRAVEGGRGGGNDSGAPRFGWMRIARWLFVHRATGIGVIVCRVHTKYTSLFVWAGPAGSLRAKRAYRVTSECLGFGL